LWEEGAWVQEEVFEKYLAGEKEKTVIGDSLPGRNEPCFCGSGKKFKKCCWGKARLERRLL
jgi:SEC-C motif domain protein